MYHNTRCELHKNILKYLLMEWEIKPENKLAIVSHSVLCNITYFITRSLIILVTVCSAKVRYGTMWSCPVFMHYISVVMDWLRQTSGTEPDTSC
jgi:hypothetical protein